MTAAELIAQVKTDIDQKGDGRFSDAELLSLLNEGYVDFCRYTECREKSANVTVDANQGVISLPSDFIEARQFRWSYNQQLFPKSERTLTSEQGDWFNLYGSKPYNLVYFNWDNMRLSPIPTSAGTVLIRQAFMPTSMGLTDEPDFPKVWHDALVDYANSECFYSMRRYSDGQAAWVSYAKRREKAKSQARAGQRTPDTMTSQRPVTIRNYNLWDGGS